MGGLNCLVLRRRLGEGIRIRVDGREAILEVLKPPQGGAAQVELRIHAPADFEVSRLELGPVDAPPAPSKRRLRLG